MRARRCGGSAGTGRIFAARREKSLLYGAVIVVLSWIVTGIGWQYGSYWAALILLSGFVFVAPVLAIGWC